MATKSGGMLVKPQSDTEVGAVAPGGRKDRQQAVDSAFRDAVASRPKVEPGGAFSKRDLNDLLRELIGDREVREAYNKVHGDKAVAQHMADLRNWRARKTDDPYASVASFLKGQG